MKNEAHLLIFGFPVIRSSRFRKGGAAATIVRVSLSGFLACRFQTRSHLPLSNDRPYPDIP